MSYYDKKNQPYVNYYTNPSSAYTQTTPDYIDAVKREQNRKQNAQIIEAAEEKRANIAANIDPRITQRQYPSPATGPADTTEEPTNTGGSGGGVNSYYNRLISLYSDKLAAEKAAQDKIKQSRIKAANKVYDASLANLNAATDSSLRQAYIKHMQDEKNLPQQMQAYGISGGATETNLANLKNAYGTNRTNIQAENLAQQRMLEQDRANAIMNAEADAANYEASAIREYNGGLLDSYASALSKNANYSTEKNLKDNVWYKRLQELISTGATTTEAIDELVRQGLDENSIDALLTTWESTF